MACALVLMSLPGLSAETDANNDPVPVPDGITACTFVPERSTVLVVGGFAGLYETCPLEGRFKLSVDLRARTASLVQIDANIVSDNPRVPVGNLGERFAMTALRGYVIGDAKIGLVGMDRDKRTNVNLTLVFTREGIRFDGAASPKTAVDTIGYRIAAFAKYDDGTGEPDDPYRIYTAEQLNAIGADPNLWDKHFRLMADIDLSVYKGDAFNIIGRPDRPFGGVFDGNGRTIRSFSYTPAKPTDCIGLFGCVAGSSAQIRNLQLADPNVGHASKNYSQHVGSLAGWVKEGTIINCHSKGARVWVFGWANVGGLVGTNEGKLRACHFSGVASGWRVGGLVAMNYGEVSACYSCGILHGSEGAGGLIGWNLRTWSARENSMVRVGQVTDCYATGYGPRAGLVQGNHGIIKRCYSTSHVADEGFAEGLVGYSDSIGTTEASFWDMEASGQTESAGGNGRTTAEMKAATTFLHAGWDFVGESANGIEDTWWISASEDYPRLWWEQDQ